GISNTNPSTSPWPNALPRSAQMAFTDPLLYQWATGCNVPVNSTWRMRFIRPNATLEYDTGLQQLNNATRWRHFWFTTIWNLPAMRTIAGVWHIQLYFNEVQQIDAPVTVVATRDPNFNRPPEPI